MKRYKVNPTPLAPRKADYKEQNYLQTVFETSEKEYFGYGNIQHDIFFKKEKRKIEVEIVPGAIEKNTNNITLPFEDDNNYIPSLEVMPCALWMYRLICLFPDPKFASLEGAEGYKMPWLIQLKHKETGDIFCIGEWKGGVTFHSNMDSFKQASQKTIDDVQRLLQLLVSDKSPHPYDGVTAGGVA